MICEEIAITLAHDGFPHLRCVPSVFLWNTTEARQSWTVVSTVNFMSRRQCTPHVENLIGGRISSPVRSDVLHLVIAEDGNVTLISSVISSNSLPYPNHDEWPPIHPPIPIRQADETKA